ncbi:hypothetical protein P7K49_039781, partial [Saguinus oedipus]
MMRLGLPGLGFKSLGGLLEKMMSRQLELRGPADLSASTIEKEKHGWAKQQSIKPMTTKS